MPAQTKFTRARSNSRNTTPVAGTFAPRFIKSEEDYHNGVERVRGIEGENDFSGKRYVWIKDPTAAFVRAWVVQELEDGKLLVQCDDCSVRTCVSMIWHG
jgi:myosin heavy chain 9/10/11/14